MFNASFTNFFINSSDVIFARILLMHIFIQFKIVNRPKYIWQTKFVIHK